MVVESIPEDLSTRAGPVFKTFVAPDATIGSSRIGDHRNSLASLQHRAHAWAKIKYFVDSLIDLVELFGTRNDYRPVRHRGNIGGYFTSCAVMEPRFHFLFLSFKKKSRRVCCGRTPNTPSCRSYALACWCTRWATCILRAQMQPPNTDCWVLAIFDPKVHGAGLFLLTDTIKVSKLCRAKNNSSRNNCSTWFTSRYSPDILQLVSFWSRLTNFPYFSASCSDWSSMSWASTC